MSSPGTTRGPAADPDETAALGRAARDDRAAATPLGSQPRGPRRGLVLGAGGVLGAAWTIGALAALEQVTGWDPRTADVIVGTSAGSVLSAFLGSGVSVETLLNHQRGVVAPEDPHFDYDYDSDTGGALPPLPRPGIGSPLLLLATARHPRRVTPMVALSSLLPTGRGSIEPVGAMVTAVTPAGEWAPHPRTWVVGTDYASGRRTVFGREGSPPASLHEAVMASCAIPGWYAPVTIGARRYVDGGACSPTSVDLAAALGLDEVVVLAPMASFDLDHPASLVGRLERRLRTVVTRRVQREAAKVRRGGTEVVLVAPGAADLTAIGVNMMDPRRRERVLETSLRTSTALLRHHYSSLASAS